MAGSNKMWKWVPTTALGAVAFSLSTEPAYAFFPPLPTGGGDTVTVSPPPAPVVIPINPTVPVDPDPTPITPVVPPFVPPPVPGTEVPVDPIVPPTVPPPATVPEPTTILSAALGLGVIGGYRWKRRKNG